MTPHERRMMLPATVVLLGMSVASLFVATRRDDKHFKPREKIGEHSAGYHLSRAAYARRPKTYAAASRVFWFLASLALAVGAVVCFAASLRAE